MADYKEANVAGTEWQRGCRVIIENPSGEAPYVVFIEEVATNLNGKVITRPLQGNLRLAFDPAKTFPAFDPTTLAQTGATYTHQQVYEIVFSLYMATALERDANQIP